MESSMFPFTRSVHLRGDKPQADQVAAVPPTTSAKAAHAAKKKAKPKAKRKGAPRRTITSLPA